MSKKQKRLQRQLELLKEFEHQIEDHYEERKVGNEWFIKMWNGGTGRWQVAVFSEQSYKNYKGGQDKYRELKEKDDFIKSIAL